VLVEIGDMKLTPKFQCFDSYGPFVLKRDAIEACANLTSDLAVAYEQLQAYKLQNDILVARLSRLERNMNL
jgi:hypothetical protein